MALLQQSVPLLFVLVLACALVMMMGSSSDKISPQSLQTNDSDRKRDPGSTSTPVLLPAPMVAGPQAIKEQAQKTQAEACTNGSLGELPNTIVKDVNGLKIVVYSRNDIVSTHLMVSSQWETGALHWLLWAMNQSTPGSNASAPPAFLDIGMNVGWFALHLAKQGHRVIGIEAMANNVALLRRSLCLNPDLQPRVTLIAKAVGANRQTCYVYSGDINVGDGLLKCVPAGTVFTAPANYTIRSTVDVERLDELVDEDVRAVKMDIEGFEYEAARGMISLLTRRRVDYIVTEFNRHMLTGQSGTYGAARLLHLLLGVGYHMSMHGFGGPLTTVEHVLAKGEVENLFFWREGSPVPEPTTTATAGASGAAAAGTPIATMTAEAARAAVLPRVDARLQAITKVRRAESHRRAERRRLSA